MVTNILKIIFSIILLSFSLISLAQTFSEQDSLRGSITPERIWWDLEHYHLSLEVVIEDKFIKGKNVISYEVLSEHQTMQIDLQSPLKITKVTQDDEILAFKKNKNAYFIQLMAVQTIGIDHCLL